MNDPESQNPYLLLLLAVGFPTFLAAIWCSVCLLLSRSGGWYALSKKFRVAADQEVDTAVEKFSMQSARIGWVSYNNCLSIQISEHGIRLAIFSLFFVGHPPLLIPWKEIHNMRKKKFLFTKVCEFEVGDPVIAKIILPQKLLQAALRLIEKEGQMNP